MRFRLVSILIVVLFNVAVHADPVDGVIEASYPRIAELASGMVLADWGEKVDSLVTSAPSAANAGGRWKQGDPHWDAAKSKLLEHIDTWARDLTADAHAREIVRQSFSRSLSPSQASTLLDDLSGRSISELTDATDPIHLGVAFSVGHPALQVGSPEFSAGFATWLRNGRITVPSGAGSPEVDALLKSDAGAAFDRARGNAIRALVTGLGGQIELRIHDAQPALLEEIGSAASACAKGH